MARTIHNKRQKPKVIVDTTATADKVNNITTVNIKETSANKLNACYTQGTLKKRHHTHQYE